MTSEEIIINTFYSDDLKRRARVVRGFECFYVDFYLDDVIIDSRRLSDCTLRYAEDTAENFVLGVIDVDENGRIIGV